MQVPKVFLPKVSNVPPYRLNKEGIMEQINNKVANQECQDPCPLKVKNFSVPFQSLYAPV